MSQFASGESGYSQGYYYPDSYGAGSQGQFGVDGDSGYYEGATQGLDPNSNYASEPAAPFCDPRFASLTINGFAKTAAIKTATKLPFAAIFQPLAQVETPVRAVNFGSAGVIRCRACRAYINPFVEFKNNYGIWVCNVCGRQNELPATYSAEIKDPAKLQDHPEIFDASFEIIAPQEYTVRPPQPPTFVFLIDVSSRAVSSGMLSIVCQSISVCLDSLPGKERTNVAFVTFDSAVHVYSLKPSLKIPQAFVLPNISDIHLPIPSDLLVNLAESRHMVDFLLQSLPRMYGETKDPERAFGPALSTASLVAHNIGGKILCFLSGLPTQGDGKLTNRDNPRLYGTEKEQTLLLAASNYFKEKGEYLTQSHLMADVLIFPDQYCDVASLGDLTLYSGGQLILYPAFNQYTDAEKVSYDIFRILSREQSWEAVFRVRASRGLKIVDYFGSFTKRSPDLLSVPNSDADKAYVVEFNNDESAIPTPTATIQCALLYSNSDGERRLRIHTLSVPVYQDHVDLFVSINPSALACYTAKKAVRVARKENLQSAREVIQFQCTDTIQTFKKCLKTYVRLSNEEDYPDYLRDLPIYTLSMLKSIAFKDGSDVPIDFRSAAHLDIACMSMTELDAFLRPRMYRIDLLTENEGLLNEYGYVTLPSTCRLSASELVSDGVFLIDNSRNFFLRVGRQVSSSFLNDLFGVSSLDNVHIEHLHVQQPANLEGNTVSNRIWNIMGYLRSISSIYQNIHVIREGDPSEVKILDALVYDRTMSVMSYEEFLGYLASQN